jgi:AcrR family transcriptional regulator
MAKGISRDAIVDAALAVLDEAGIDGLTLRAVAARLDVKAPALYWHVRDKKALLDEMGTRVWSEIGQTAGGHLTGDGGSDDWRRALVAYADATRRGLLAHRDGARAFSGTYLTDPTVLQRQEESLAWMQTQGFSIGATTDAVSILTAFVVGTCIEEQERAQAPEGRYDIAIRDRAVDARAHPRVAASGRHMRADDADTRFAAQLAIVLDGIAGLRTAPAPPEQRPGTMEA